MGGETNVLALDGAGEAVFSSDLSSSLGAVSGTLSEDASSSSAASRSATKVLSASSRLVVVPDPDHGGYDGGASGNGVTESVVNLKIAQYCREELEKYLFVDVCMTREDDSYVSLGDRLDFAVGHNADLMVGIHNNALMSSSAHGSEVIVPNDSSWYYDENHVVGMELGQMILDQLTSLRLSVSNGVYWRDATAPTTSATTTAR